MFSLEADLKAGGPGKAVGWGRGVLNWSEGFPGAEGQCNAGGNGYICAHQSFCCKWEDLTRVCGAIVGRFSEESMSDSGAL